MCPDLGFRKHDPCNRRTLYPQVRELRWRVQGAEGRVEDVEMLCKDLPRCRCKRCIIIFLSSLLAITSDSGGPFQTQIWSHCAFHLRPPPSPLPLLRTEARAVQQPSGPAWPGVLPIHPLPHIPWAPAQAFSPLESTTLLPAPGPLHTPFVQNFCPSLLVNSLFLSQQHCNHISSRKHWPPLPAGWILLSYNLIELCTAIHLFVNSYFLSVDCGSDSTPQARNILVNKRRPWGASMLTGEETTIK